MKPKPLLLFALVATGLGIFFYLTSYVAICLVEPGCINSPDGPITAFRLVYYPLRRMASEKPQWYSTAVAHHLWLEAKIDWINRGNGYLYFTQDGHEYRAACDGSDGFREGDLVLLHFAFELVTYDDFRSRLVPTIDNILLQHPNTQ
jgi:hypothetical protein